MIQSNFLLTEQSQLNLYNLSKLANNNINYFFNNKIQLKSIYNKKNYLILLSLAIISF